MVNQECWKTWWMFKYRTQRAYKDIIRRSICGVKTTKDVTKRDCEAEGGGASDRRKVRINLYIVVHDHSGRPAGRRRTEMIRAVRVSAQK